MPQHYKLLNATKFSHVSFGIAKEINSRNMYPEEIDMINLLCPSNKTNIQLQPIIGRKQCFLYAVMNLYLSTPSII